MFPSRLVPPPGQIVLFTVVVTVIVIVTDVGFLIRRPDVNRNHHSDRTRLYKGQNQVDSHRLVCQQIPCCLSVFVAPPEVFLVRATGTNRAIQRNVHTGSHWFQNGKQMFVSLVNAVWYYLLLKRWW
jgi:hypothetical protein